MQSKVGRIGRKPGPLYALLKTRVSEVRRVPQWAFSEGDMAILEL